LLPSLRPTLLMADAWQSDELSAAGYTQLTFIDRRYLPRHLTIIASEQVALSNPRQVLTVVQRLKRPRKRRQLQRARPLGGAEITGQRLHLQYIATAPRQQQCQRPSSGIADQLERLVAVTFFQLIERLLKR